MKAPHAETCSKPSLPPLPFLNSFHRSDILKFIIRGQRKTEPPLRRAIISIITINSWSISIHPSLVLFFQKERSPLSVQNGDNRPRRNAWNALKRCKKNENRMQKYCASPSIHREGLIKLILIIRERPLSGEIEVKMPPIISFAIEKS